ncbi:MAG: NAD-binding protein, partial [Sphingomicrobium sp.]
LLESWPQVFLALALVLVVKVLVTGSLLWMSGSRPAVAAETGLLMASPSETTLILLGAGAVAGLINPQAASFWQVVTALGLTITPLLARLGRIAARRVDQTVETLDEGAAKGRTVIFGFGRVGQMVADMLAEHKRAYLAVENDIDAVLAAREDGYNVLFGDVARSELVEKLNVDQADALVLTMDDPVLIVRLAKRLRAEYPDLPIIARARDTGHAARLYKAGVTDAVPETLEASLQLAEAVLADVGVAMGPVIASIHEKRDQLRAEIMMEGELDAEPSLGRRRLRDSAEPAKGS